MIEFYKKHNTKGLIKIKKNQYQLIIENDFYCPEKFKDCYAYIRIKIGDFLFVKNDSILIRVDEDGKIPHGASRYSFEELFEKFPEIRGDFLFNMDILK